MSIDKKFLNEGLNKDNHSKNRESISKAETQPKTSTPRPDPPKGSVPQKESMPKKEE